MSLVATLICNPANPALDSTVVDGALAVLPSPGKPQWLFDEVAIDIPFEKPIENHDQVLHLLRKWKAEGRVRYIGATQWSPEYYDTLERLVRTGGLDFIQVNYSVASRRFS